ncbi:MAG: sporulation transcriptional regulator SpoIIID [Corallococcus sp.]|nr:sporulation transcriptional regulator SpoIIID [Corallococcus sp.]MCM1360055.1 sporulation transcriptional regulator SpoIIID [Corallococcus sp.]MCM1395612.1 sporulation transcriptional regulator SpoIIID [Corallococcus sp.]
MKDYIVERVKDVAEYLVENKCTVREVGKAFCVSKSTAHKDLSERLPVLDKALFEKVCLVLDENWQERYIRGGMATKQKYKKER